MQASDPLLRDTSRRRAGHASLRRQLPRPQSLASALDFLGRRKLARQLSLGSLRERVVQGVQRLYLAHELLLLAFYQRRSPAVWIDPLARWRSLWRTFGTAVLLLNALLFTSAAWVHWRCEATAAPTHPPQLTAATLHLTCPPVLFGFTMHGELFGQVASVELLNLGRSTTCSLRLPGGSALRRLAPPLPALHGHRPREAGPPHTAAVPRGNPPGAWPRLPARARRSRVRHGGAVLLTRRAN